MDEAAQRLPAPVRLGTSSWAFPGWAGIVYDREAPKGALSRKGLQPYARHPLLRCVGVDRTYYGPLPAEQFEEYAALVPGDFRFIVKADRAITFPSFAAPGRRTFHENPDFLDGRRATDSVVGPVVAGLGDRLGALLFQFPPVSERTVGGAHRFADTLHRFLRNLPPGVPYAVELRTRGLLEGRVRRAVGDAGAQLVNSVHPALPPIAEQVGTNRVDKGPLLIRWMLGHGQRYEEAKERYHPFNALVDPDPTSRRAIAKAVIDAATAGREAFVVVNNKAEGSSPLSIVELAKEIVAQHEAAASTRSLA